MFASLQSSCAGHNSFTKGICVEGAGIEDAYICNTYNIDTYIRKVYVGSVGAIEHSRMQLQSFWILKVRDTRFEIQVKAGWWLLPILQMLHWLISNAFILKIGGTGLEIWIGTSLWLLCFCWFLCAYWSPYIGWYLSINWCIYTGCWWSYIGLNRF